MDKIARMAGFDYVFKTSHWGTKALDGSVKFEVGNAILSRIPFTKTKGGKSVWRVYCSWGYFGL